MPAAVFSRILQVFPYREGKMLWHDCLTGEEVLKVSVLRMLQSQKRKRKGQGMVEYALIIGFIAILLVAVIRLVPQPLEELFEEVATALGTPPT